MPFTAILKRIFNSSNMYLKSAARFGLRIMLVMKEPHLPLSCRELVDAMKVMYCLLLVTSFIYSVRKITTILIIANQ